MSVVSYRCPNTNEQVTTSIESGKETLLRMRTSNLTIWLWCPHCMAGHQVAAADADVLQHADLAQLEVD